MATGYATAWFGLQDLARYPFRRNLAFYCADPISSAQHTVKLVLTVPRGNRVPVVVPPTRVPAFRPDGSYIVTGGMGGLGLFLAAAMASAGCGRIVLTSRSGPNAQAERTIARLKANGADIVVECGNIAEPETASRLVAAATATGLPLRGVLHAAAVVDDATLANITDELVARDWAPEAYGAWNLHHAVLGRPIDPNRSFAEHGLDSLGMLELRTSIETQTGVRLSSKTIVTYNTARTPAHLSETLQP